MIRQPSTSTTVGRFGARFRCFRFALAAATAIPSLLTAQTFDYDDAGRLTFVRFTDGRGVRYTHDDAGNLASVAPVQIVPAPTSFTVAAGDGFSQSLLWNNGAGQATGVVVQRRIAGRYTWETLATLGPDSTSYLDPLDGYDNRYLYRVYATGSGVTRSAYTPEFEMTRRQSSYLPGARDLGSGWTMDDAFGPLYTAAFPWLFSRDHGWWFVAGNGAPDFFFYDLQLGWLWTTRDLHPYFYSYTRRAFLYYAGTESDQRTFYDFGNQEYKTVPLSR